MPAMAGVFLSYARADDEPFAERLHDELRRSRVAVWWDRRAMSNRGRTFLQEIREAIEQAERVVLIVGPAAVDSAYVREEWTHALTFAKGVVPVLRIGDFALIPAELLQLHCVDFREPRPLATALQELLRILAEPMAPAGPLLTEVPSLPPRFQPRGVELDTVRSFLLSDLLRPSAEHADERVTAINGMGGIGKSVLAAAVARNIDMRRAFKDGIAWFDCGDPSGFQWALKGIGAALDERHHAKYLNLETARHRLPEALRDRACLLVLDDVRAVSEIQPFLNALSPRSRLLITTRDGNLPSVLGAHEHTVEVMDAASAQRLLADWAEAEASSLPAPARGLLDALGGLPLAISLCGAMARAGTPWQDLAEAFEERDLDFAEARLPNYRYATVQRSLEVSLSRLAADDPRMAARYHELAVFRRARGLPAEALLAFWRETGSITGRSASKLLRQLERRGLLRLSDDYGKAASGIDEPPYTMASLIFAWPRSGQVSLHDLQYGHLRTLAPDRPELHRALLQAYAGLADLPAEKALDDGYYVRHLGDHLNGAGWQETNAALRALGDAAIAHAPRLAETLVQMLLPSIAGAAPAASLPVQSGIDRLLEDCARRGVPLGRAAVLRWLVERLFRELEQRVHDTVRKAEALSRQRDYLRQALAQCHERSAPAAEILALEEELSDANDALLLANIAVQAAMQEHQSLLVHMSNVAKVKHDAAIKPFREIR